MVRDRFDNEAKLGRIQSPILIVQGDADTLVRPANARRLASANSAARLIMVPDAGHELAYGETGQVAVLAWLKQLPTRLHN
jgi:uncharacterized protein